MLFYSKLNSKHKTSDKKTLTIKPYRFPNDLFALKKCSILHIANLSSNKKISGIKLLMNIMLII